MTKKRNRLSAGLALLALVAVGFLASLAASPAAHAASIDDLKAMGYTVGIAFVRANGCTVYTISGWGASIYADTCDPGYQATIDSLADPVAQCNRVWQIQHPDQYAAYGELVSLGASVTGDQCKDVYTVSVNGSVVYSGPGSGLAGARTAVEAALAAGKNAPAQPGGGGGGNCLPLCPTPGGDPGTPPTTTTAPAPPSTTTGSTSTPADPPTAPPVTTTTSAPASAPDATTATEIPQPLGAIPSDDPYAINYGAVCVRKKLRAASGGR